MSRFTGKYADDGKSRRLAVREAAGHRCIRCNHPFQIGKHGKGEWSPCDVKCTHGGPIRVMLPHESGWTEVTDPEAAARVFVVVHGPTEAQWRILTVHHLDGNKGNDEWWNTLALDQRCHLEIQGKVDPNIPFIFEHSNWFKPYAAGFYAHKYLNQNLTREEVMDRLDELLALERLA